jgi:hypothetical protein
LLSVRPAIGDPVEATLLGFQAPINGRIESITGGISAANAASSTQGLPNVDVCILGSLIAFWI